MSDPLRVTRSDDRPPSPPPLAPNRQLSAKAGVLQRLVAPLGFGFTARQAGAQDPRSGGHHVRGNTGELRNTTSREENAAYRTGIPISAIDISPHRTHAILAGREILKTIKVDDGKVTEDFDLRSALGSYASTRRTIGNRDFLPATDVKWSHKEHDTKIATAASNGRIVIYDLTKPEVELLRVHEHDRQVHKLAFNPFSAAKLLSGSQDGTLRLWDLRLFDGERDAVSMKSQSTFYGHADSVRDVRWSTGDGFEFAFCTDSGSVQLWDFRNPSAPKMRINAHDKACYALDWHPDGRHVATAGLDKHVKIWDLAKLDRRQKPLWVVRTPQAIMNLRWRPACWTWEMQESGDWQCTQLATSYNQEDSRVHVWDLRRPHIPFREITRAGRGPPSDLLWHSKDLLWSVGEDGNFQQTDTKYAPQVLDQLNPCQISFTPDGGFVKFSEKGAPRRSFGWQEASDGFLNQRPGHELTAKSRSWDEDDTNNEGYMAANFRRRAHKAASRYPKSQGNTPPSRDERMELVPLEKSVRKSGSYKNRQLGLLQEITGASLNDEAFHFLALNYAQPLTEEERRQSPESILGRLEAAFLQNAEVCGEVAMYRLAQTWRIIGAVLIPELTAWAEMNRRNRLSQGSCANHAENNDQLSKGLNKILSQDQGTISNYNVEDDQPTKFKQHVFKGVFESTVKQESIDEPSSSNITTPIAGPNDPLRRRSYTAQNGGKVVGRMKEIEELP
ncbi:putative wd repeat protein [Phaeomoniella chlamydospora]|uniref:Putative wd repeat protein n=1 Tax=Phaeomoniella chlamydospora TaxID=158046 RepID=A0A0G2FR18_PHACM|nr:putative wd repeat protein [Phaeomoniella chlamydospora]